MRDRLGFVRSKPFIYIAVAVLIYLLVILSRVVWQNYQVNQQVSLLKQQVDTLRQSNSDLKAEILYYQTPEYAEKVARAKLGLQKPGEQVVIVPPTGSKSQALSTSASKIQSNWQAWWDFFFGSTS